MSNGKVEKIKKELEIIRAKNSGFLTPGDVVEYAKNPHSELHSKFTWNDGKAAEAYRLHQASAIIRHIKVDIITNPLSEKTVKVSCYVSLPKERRDDKYGYREIREVLSKDDLKLQYIESVRDEFNSFRKKLANVSEAAEKMGDRLAKQLQKEHSIILQKITPKRSDS